jgi:ribosomal protein L37AE/L43A
MKIFDCLLNNIVCPLVVLILAPSLIGILSKLNTGEWMSWFMSIPKIYWGNIGFLFFLWIIIIIIRIRLKQINKSNTGPMISVIKNPIYGWLNIGAIEYAGALWRLNAPKPGPFIAFEPSDVSPSNIEVDLPPRCPKCETELEESKCFFSGYIWKCVKCGFRKKNKNSYYIESERVEKIARRDWEERLIANK